MGDRISINIQSLQNILKRLKHLNEEATLLINDVNKTLQNAELEGWNDQTYHAFYDQFFDTQSLLRAGLKRVEEEHIPTITKLIRNAENF